MTQIFVRWMFLIGLLVPAVRSTADDEVVQRIIQAGRTDNQVMDHLDVMTNRIGARLTGSDGLQRGCEWAAEKFKELGLENVRLEKWGEVPVGFDRGPWYGQMLEPKRQPLIFGTNAWTAGTKGRQSAIATLAPKDLEQLESVKEQLKGTWIFATPPQVSRRDPQYREKMRAFRKVLEVLKSCEPAGIVRPSRDPDLIVTSGSFRISWDNLPTIPMITLQRRQWDEILEQLSQGERVVLEFDIRNHFKKGPIPQYNVIADIPGTEWPDQYVIVGGHIDSWDGATGATDNASGCATAIEAARILMQAKVKPRRTIRFMLWSGEEQGLLGSRAYVEQNPQVCKNTSAVFVHDGGTNYVSGIGVTEAMRPDFEKICVPIMKLDARTPFRIDTVDYLRGGGSDHSSFLRGGVPGFFWRQAGRAVYRQTHHTQYDTYDTVVPEYQRHSSIVIALVAHGVANLDHLLSREGVVRRR